MSLRDVFLILILYFSDKKGISFGLEITIREECVNTGLPQFFVLLFF